SPRLRHLLGRNVVAPEWVIEDACQAAWAGLLAAERPVAREHVLGWLATTARREVFLILRRADRELPLDDGPGDAGVLSGAAQAWDFDPQRAAEFAERLGEVRRLPSRQQRLVWMRGLGFGYPEIQAETGDSVRTISRQLTAARRRLRAA
ncbi:MAG: sigma-70 family RNA polymerase sigma factor, partial [Solirubrobacterales bacterium]|nr:sigma-70 family RNA polymerase sigma factor [Solirubrobacterales bacterium]